MLAIWGAHGLSAELNRTHLFILPLSMASSDYPPAVSGCLVFSIEALCFLIFKRLPVKSLCRFRCVCRSWNSLITSPSFVSEHFSLVASAAEKSYLLFNRYSSDRQLFALYHPHKRPKNQVTYLDHPFQARNLCIIDVIHGMVCLRYNFDGSVDNAILWNPSIHKYLIIPGSHSFCSSYCRKVGFGFQSSKNDFKVVNISYHPHGLGPQVCEVYSVQSGIRVPVASGSTVGSHAGTSYSACFLNGTIHWIVALAQERGNRTYALLCFDCEHDKLSKMELPQEFTHSSPQLVLRCGDRLSVYTGRVTDGAHELWVMDKYGVVTTWNMLFRIGHPTYLNSIVVRGEDGDIMVYDDVQALAMKTKKRLRNRKPYLPVIAGVFEESLFSFEQKCCFQDSRITLCMRN